MERACEVLPQDIPTLREQLGKLPRVGYKWEAGYVEANDARIYFSACMTREGWKVVREVYLKAASPMGKKVLGQYGFGEDMERYARALAVNLCRAMTEESHRELIPQNSQKTTRRTT
jgi:hypothetical protein